MYSNVKVLKGKINLNVFKENVHLSSPTYLLHVKVMLSIA